MHELDILIVAAPDTEPEKRHALRLIAELNDRYRGRLAFTPSFVPNGRVEAALALVWSEADDALAPLLDAAARAPETLLLHKTTRVSLDLSQRDEVLAKLQAKARLDELLQAHEAAFRRVPFDDGGFWSALERELRRLADRTLGVDSGPLNLRPRLGGTYLTRPRLLRLLPDAPGHVVALEAPYGYGKSVLAAQWAAELEGANWRVLWLAADPHGSDLRPLLTGALGIAPNTPDPLLRERLWETPTLLVLEDLQGGEPLEVVLDGPGGLVLLASRTPLDHPGLARLAAAGRVTRLGANELAFSRSEAEHLTGDAEVGAALRGETLGWPLPLHIASLTGSAPDPGSLLAGIRSSLDEDAWRELLLLAALPQLPRAAAGPHTPPLVARGFVQALESSYRLHPFVADLALDAHPDAVAEVVARDAERLPLLLRGEAFARVGDVERLTAVLEATDAELWRQAPARLVQWDETVAGLHSARRHWAVGAALQRLHDFPAAVERLSLALEAPDLGPDERLGIMRELCLPLGVLDNARGRELLARAEPLLESARPEVAARFLGNAALVHAHGQDPEAAIRYAERALERYPEHSPLRVAAELNLALFRYDLHGDFDGRLEAQLATLARVREQYPVQALGQCRDLGMFHWWLGDTANARRFLEQARDGDAVNPAIGTEARAALGFMDGAREVVADMARRAGLFGDPYVADIVSMYKILQEEAAGEFAQAKRSFERSPQGSFAACAYARALAAQGDAGGAVALLDNFRPTERNRRLYLSATRFLVTRDRAALDEFLSLTTAGVRLLPGFIPLEALPDDPALARHYPIREVLRAGGERAIASRRGEIPELRVRLLGDLEVRLLGDPVDLTLRQKQIATLLTLGCSREQLAEAMWPESDANKQRNNLNVQLNALRKIVEPWGVPTYLFEDGWQRVASDHAELNAALEAGDADLVHARYREPLAPGIDLPPVEGERGRLREAVVALLFDASAAAPNADAVAFLERVLALEPLHEEALQRLLRTLLQLGRRREARQRYEGFRERLEAEMGLEPLDATREILGL